MANGYVSVAEQEGIYAPASKKASNTGYSSYDEVYADVGKDYSDISTSTKGGAEERLASARGSGNDGGYAADADASYMNDRDWQIIQDLNAKFAEAQAAGDTATMNALHEQAERIRAGYGYSGGADGSQYIVNEAPAATRTKSGSGGSGGEAVEGPLLESVQAAQAAARTSYEAPQYTAPQYTAPSYEATRLDETAPDVSPTGKYHADTASLKNTLEQWKQTAIQQQNGMIDYNVAKAVDELERALQDAQPQFQEQAASVARDERQGMDNSALYAQLRGDNGGIGQAQYNEIQAQAAKNRLTIQQAQTKLSTDTARQIEDLRAQGEFEKADAALQISQQYLQQLMSLEQWAAEYNLSADQFEASLSQWASNYQASMAQFNINTQTSYDQLNAGLQSSYDQLNAELQSSYDQLNANMKLGYDQLNSGLDLDWAQLSQNQSQYDSDLAYKYAALAQDQKQYEAGLNYNYASLAQAQNQFAAQLAQNQSQYGSDLDYKYAALGQDQSQFDASLSNTNTTNYNKQLVDMGNAMLAVGIMPTDQQLTAMGLTQNQANQYLLQKQLEQAAASNAAASKSSGSSSRSSSSSSSGSSSGSVSSSGSGGSAYQSLYNEISHINPGTGVNVAGVYSNKISNALGSGSITGTEADKLLRMLGY